MFAHPTLSRMTAKPLTPWDLGLYSLDALQRTLLLLDTLIARGNNDAEIQRQDQPNLLHFAHEPIQDGRDLDPPCNYVLLRVIAPDGTPCDPRARPIIVLDPRAGNGPGIAGFKNDSEVGVALRAGHPVYCIAFRAEPQPGQTLDSVTQALAAFAATVAQRHPHSTGSPILVGNCQAGWALLMMAATHPEHTGALILIGAPVAFWSGASVRSPLAYTAVWTGGSWPSVLLADLGAGYFDGAWLVENFERLDPARSLWDKPYALWRQIDTDAERFLAFERWWGSFFRLTAAEIEAISEQLFIGNKLVLGQMESAQGAIDLKAIEAPILVLCSWADTITPPPQALNWIIDTWGDERAIAAAGRVIVYLIHNEAGHLGLFVSGSVARKEHNQLIESLDIIEQLPPGLYEMRIERKDGRTPSRWDELEPGDYQVQFLHRSMNDLYALNAGGRADEAGLDSLSQFSHHMLHAYKTWISPWVRAWVSPPLAQALAPLQPLRLQRRALSDAWPAAPWVHALARLSRSHRVQAPIHPTLLDWERSLAHAVHDSLDSLRQLRNALLVDWARWVCGPQGLGAWFAPRPSPQARAQAQAEQTLTRARAMALAQATRGGFAEAVCRIVVAGMLSDGVFERRSLRLARLLSRYPASQPEHRRSPEQWNATLKSQARIVAVAPLEALQALPALLPVTEDRATALAVAAAVFMIDLKRSNPRNDFIEDLMQALGLDAQQVMARAQALSEGVQAMMPESPDDPKVASSRSAPRRRPGKRPA
ncbi:MAG: DUF3141 domain-containing protein [Rhodoferax sp.]